MRYLYPIHDKSITAFAHFFALRRGLLALPVFAAGFFSLAAEPLAFVLGAVLDRASRRFSGAGCPASDEGAGSADSAAASAGARRGRGGAVLFGLRPSVRISVMRMSVNSWRWPRLRREFLRRRFLNAMTFGPRD